MFLLNKPYLSDFKKSVKVCCCFHTFKELPALPPPRFFDGDAKVSAFIYPTNYFSNKTGEKFESRMF